MTTNRFTARLSDSDDYRRELLIQKIAHAVEQLKLSELEALSYDMFTKGLYERGIRPFRRRMLPARKPTS